MNGKSQDGALTGREDEAQILGKINEAMCRLGRTAEYSCTLPVSGTESLRGKKITILDDTNMILELLVPMIITATKGEGDFVEYKGGTAEEVANQIMAQSPEIVLLDYDLGKKITGADVAIALREKGYDGVALGFSSINRGKGGFPEDKVNGTILKNTADSSGTLRRVAEFVSTLN